MRNENMTRSKISMATLADEAEPSAGDAADLRRRILQGLHPTSLPKHIPFSLLYDSTGSSLYDLILSQAPSYYLYAAELLLLRRHSAAIAAALPPDCLLLELGCGSASKSTILLNAVLARHGRCQYVGIDVSPAAIDEAERNLLQSVGRNRVSLSFIEGDYLPSVKRAKAMFPDKVMCVMWIGSSIGNLDDDESVTFIKQVADILGTKAIFFLCTDLWKEPDILYRAYCDEGGYTERFIKNGMKHALSRIGYRATKAEEESWEYRVTVNSKRRRVEMWVVFPEGLDIPSQDVRIRSGEAVLVEFSRKFIVEDIEELTAKSGLYVHAAWRDRTYSCQMLYSAHQELLSCWTDTDAIFDAIDDWSEKPIDLRHPFLFYYGHVAAFSSLKLLNGAVDSGTGNTDDGNLDFMFSRGIDPYVLDDSVCHAHPEPPSQWPPRDRVVAYVENIRSRLMAAAVGGAADHRLVCLTLEHERMHQETLTYMLAQRRKAEFELKAKKTQGLLPRRRRHENGSAVSGEEEEEGKYVLILPGSVRMGATAPEMVFTWDNERPSTDSSLSSAFAVSPRAVSIRQYLDFVVAGGYDVAENWRSSEDFEQFKRNGIKWPATWSEIDGDFYVHRPWETKHWTEVGGDPVYVSLAEAEAYCRWAGDGRRIMTEEEYHRALDVNIDGQLIQDLKTGGWEWTSTPFAGFPGFQAMPEYPEYSADFFDGNHFVLKGSSPSTHPSLLRESFRNFYQRQYRFVFAKFRCCRSVPAPELVGTIL